ncbi:unnamed protein product [Ambrosiozyma monospora]|uniref:Unnamed protein product n=1 Tax=Ambrosiozyma monospora TaxID=43982 RepID=A0ACB5T1A3_AMBMO|nr:unnamed protein product [Ambrosiozyma monospora]
MKIRAIPISAEFDYARTFLQIKISGFFMKVDKPELFQSLINSMYESSLAKKEFVQAALSLGLLAKTYDWDDSYYLPACEAPKFPAQSEFKRKESLFKMMASNFVKGGKVDQAIDIYNELLSAYKKYNFDLNGLSFCHGELCKAYRHLENTGTLDPSYFLLNFIGSGFPVHVRGKQFIHEDQPFMHITSLIQKLNRIHVGSRIITNEDEAKRLASEPQVGKYLFVKAVSPGKSLSESTHFSYMTQKFIDNKNLNVFVSTRRIPGSTNICDLWTEEVTYETEATFPTLMNFSEIKNSCAVKISPIKNAIKSLVDKNSELKGLEYLLNRNLKEGIDPKTIAGSTVFSDLSRVLAGTVDSPVNGGVGQYRAFFTLDSSEPDYQEDVSFLKKCFTDLIVLLDKLLKLHGALIPSNLIPQHSAMVELFSKNFKTEIDELQLDVNVKLNLEELVHRLIKANIRTHRHRHHQRNQLDLDVNSFMGNSATGSSRDDDTYSMAESTRSGGSSLTRKSSSYSLTSRSTSLDSVLLIGGAGFLGLHLIQQFWEESPRPDIHVFDIRPLPDKISKYFTFDPSKITCHIGDLTSEDDIKKAIKSSQCKVIVHSASPMHGMAQEIYEKVNVHGTANLIKCAKDMGIQVLVYTSSAGVIFNGQPVHNADESWPIPEVPMDGYNETKAIAEEMVLRANSFEDKFYTVALRPAGIFGPGDRQLVPGLRTVLKNGQTKFQVGDNNNLFDWTYAGNVADSHVLAAKKLLDPVDQNGLES